MNTSTTYTFPYDTILFLADKWENNPIIQTIVGYSQLTFGAIGAYQLATSFNQKKIKKLSHPTWKEKLSQIFTTLGNISLIIRGLVSAPALRFYEWNAKQLLTTTHFDDYFGEATQIKRNNFLYMLRLGSLILGLPATIKFCFYCYEEIKNTFVIKDKEIKPFVIRNNHTNLFLTVHTTLQLTSMSI